MDSKSKVMMMMVMAVTTIVMMVVVLGELHFGARPLHLRRVIGL